MSTEEDKGVTSRAEEFLQVFKKGAEFTQELLKRMSGSVFRCSSWKRHCEAAVKLPCRRPRT